MFQLFRLMRIYCTLAIISLSGCTHFAVQDCGEKVLGKDEPRIRSSHFRMLLADLPAASQRFAPFAAMSALAYAEDADCGNDTQKLKPEDRFRLESALAEMGWMEVKDKGWSPPCEDNTGLFSRVWSSEINDTRSIVVAFRGTLGVKDWLYGNLHWLTRFFPMEDQYSQARGVMQRVIDHYSKISSHSPTRYYTTGHSLGGGLAQHALYSYPNDVVQSFAFDPSSVTGFSDQLPSTQVSACECRRESPEGESRIFRIYDSYEVLANIRIFHKFFFSPERHIQEVRFPNTHSHSMINFANYLLQNGQSDLRSLSPWFAGKGNYTSEETCTAAFIRKQRESCEVAVSSDQWNKCPQ